MLKYDVLMIMEMLDPSVKHWHDTICYANYLLIAMFVQLCARHWHPGYYFNNKY
ncbi:MAG: hypothetical protein ACR5K3_04165 [Wolbachia sp.]